MINKIYFKILSILSFLSICSFLLPISFKFLNPYYDVKILFSSFFVFIFALFFFPLKRNIKISRSIFIYFILILWKIISILYFKNFNLIFENVAIHLIIFTFLLIVNNSYSLNKKFYKQLNLVFSFIILYLLLQSFGLDFYNLSYKKVSTIGNPDLLTFILLPIFIFNYYFSQIEDQKVKKIFLCICLFSIIIVGVRSAILFMGLFIIYEFLNASKLKKQMKISLFLTIVFLSGIFITGEIIKKNNSILSRYYLYRDTLKGSFSSFSSFVFGYGTNSYIQHFQKFRSIELQKITGSGSYSDNSHNYFLDILFENGLIGLIILLFLILNMLKENWNNRKKIIYIFSLMLACFIISPKIQISCLFIFFAQIILDEKTFFKMNIFFYKILFGVILFSVVFFNILHSIESYKVNNYTKYKDSKMYTDNGMYYYHIGNFYRKEGELEKSKNYYEKSINKNPNFWPSLYNNSVVLYLQGNYENSLKMLDKVTGINFLKKDVYFYKGLNHLKLKNKKMSFENLYKCYILSNYKDKQTIDIIKKYLPEYIDKFDKILEKQ